MIVIRGAETRKLIISIRTRRQIRLNPRKPVPSSAHPPNSSRSWFSWSPKRVSQMGRLRSPLCRDRHFLPDQKWSGRTARRRRHRKSEVRGETYTEGRAKSKMGKEELPGSVVTRTERGNRSRPAAPVWTDYLSAKPVGYSSRLPTSCASSLGFALPPANRACDG
jgi:hypothetical protein